MPEKGKSTKIDFSTPHVTKGSKLKPFIDDLRLARSNNWPLRDIRSWLMDEHELEVSLSNLGAFCERYGLEKGKVGSAKKERIRSKEAKQKTSSTGTKKKFSFGAKEQENFRKRATGE